MYALFNITLFMLLINIVSAEQYEGDDNANNDANDVEVNSVESDSDEIFNTTSKEKPGRVNDLENELKEYITKILPTCNDAKSSTLKAGNSMKYRCSYPYAVSIQKRGSHYASGVLIDKKWILTTAREFYNIRESIKLFRARLGSVNCKKGGILIPLKKIEIHPLYTYKQPKFDLALLRIAQPFELSEHIKSLGLSKSKGMVINAKFMVTYWPRLIINGSVLPNTAKERLKQNSMRVSTQTIIPWKQCKAIFATYNYSLDASNFCLEPIKSHHSPCTPDAGAPVVGDDGLWGITSGWTSEDCLDHLIPTIVTRTSSPLIQPWLDSLA